MENKLHWIGELQKVSPMARQVCESASYLLTEGGADIDNIIASVVEAADLDLRDRGFFVDNHLSEPNSTQIAQTFYELLGVPSQDYLDQLFEKHPDKLDDFKDLIVSNTFDELDDETKFEYLLEYLRGEFPNDVQLKELNTVCDSIEYHYNSTYIQYLTEVIEAIPYVDLYDVESVLQYMPKFSEIMIANRAMYKDCIELVLNKYDLDKTYLEQSVHNYDLEKTQPVNIANFTWILGKPEEELSDLEKTVKKQIILRHEKDTSHHIEYYYTHPEVLIEKEQLVELVAHHIEPDSSPDQRLQDIVSMVKNDWALTKSPKTLKLSRFTSEQVSFIKELTLLFLSKTHTEKDIEDAFKFFSS